MTQHLNLLVKKVDVVKQSTRQIVPPLLISLLLPLGLWAMNIDTEARARADEAKMKQQLESTRTRLDARLKDAGASTDKEMEALKAQAQSAQAVIAKLDELGSRDGYSRYFAALAGISEAGVWLTSIDVVKNGKGLALSGRALDQAAVMRYVTKLNAQLASEGVSFSGLEVTPENASGKPGFINFKLY